MRTLYAPEYWEDPRFNTSEDDAKAEIVSILVNDGEIRTDFFVSLVEDYPEACAEIARLALLAAVKANTPERKQLHLNSIASLVRVMVSRVVDAEWKKDKCKSLMGWDA